ncbi:MAG: hypothetical protein R3E64_12180 [Halioglobus sp.]
MNFYHSVGKKVALFFALVVIAGFTASCDEKGDSSAENAASPEVMAPAVSGLPMAGSTSPMMSPNVSSAGPMEAMVEQLRAKLENNPGDIQGWILLSQSYQFLQRWPEAEEAFSEAKKLGYEGAMPSTEGGTVGGNTSSAETQAGQTVFDDMRKLAAESEAQTPATTDNSSNGISVTVSISSALLNTVDPEALVFIFARSVPSNNGQPSGPPLAAVKKKVSELPVTLTLDDSMAMMPQFSLSSADRVMIGARISKSGSPMKQADDIESIVGPVDSNTSDAIDIVIGADGRSQEGVLTT